MDTVPEPALPQFGIPICGKAYIDRPGVYALALRDDQVLVVETPAGYFLPGGGTDVDESDEAALRRELLEETGLEAGSLTMIGVASQSVIEAATGIGYNKIETFYLATDLIEHAPPAEPDHQPRWVTIPDALAGLREPAQVWALRRAIDFSKTW